MNAESVIAWAEKMAQETGRKVFIVPGPGGTLRLTYEPAIDALEIVAPVQD